MSTTMTATFPNMAFASDTAAGTIHGAPTMPVGALAWSLADDDEPASPAPIPARPALSTPKPRITRPALVVVLFGAVTAAAALGAIMLGAAGEPSTPLAVVDHTQTAPYVAPAPLPTVNHVDVPAPVPAASVVSAPAVIPPKVVAPTQTSATPPAPPKSTQRPDRPRWDWSHWNRHHRDQQDPQH
ncbi:hypothetical protein [Mycolicibacterium sp. CBMA 226]|uniref:hypothetical protein n=1 Tax=Mycolicibacterium sp. CBMA 226 TaxID=2606611 RepID=UPI0012DDD241|nr:hypothetical protein [Mycolicibacterium sp. CBMA 226]MUL77312.1 hypothetical protein [Mycolicibacterium sp. CBMA 226]